MALNTNIHFSDFSFFTGQSSCKMVCGSYTELTWCSSQGLIIAHKMLTKGEYSSVFTYLMFYLFVAQVKLGSFWGLSSTRMWPFWLCSASCKSLSPTSPHKVNRWHNVYYMYVKSPLRMIFHNFSWLFRVTLSRFTTDRVLFLTVNFYPSPKVILTTVQTQFTQGIKWHWIIWATDCDRLNVTWET